jgi:hypothetical protein
LSFSGCLEEESHPTKNPQRPLTLIDQKDNIYIRWNPQSIKKIDSEGNVLFSNYSMFLIGSIKMLIDSQENLHLIYLKGGEFGYTKLNNEGEIIIPYKEIQTNNSEFNQYISGQSETVDAKIDLNGDIHICSIGKKEVWHTILDEEGHSVKEFNLTNYMGECTQNDIIRIYIDIDVDLNLHVFWDNGVKSYGDDINKKNGSKIYYLKQLSNGTVAINATLTISNTSILRANDVVTDSENNVYIFWDEYSTEPFYGPGLHDPIHSYLEKLDFNGSLIYKKEITAMAVTDACMDANNNIHVVGTTGATGGYPDNDNGVYLKLDSDGDVLVGPVQFTNKVMSQSGRLAVDSVGNVHIVWHGKETRWKSYPMTTYEEPVDYYTVYYSKLDSNDNIIIDEKVIDADEKPEDTMFSSLCLVMIGIIIVVATVITIVLLVRRKKQTKQQRDEHVG